ncbi:YHS domain-containing protein [Pedobacter jamesrossensis]|uniref:YHS domain-containing protein n=1 Tax=Pedobacter jamesrossensis TaxID=1908238 RepID=A0ABV8NMT2_9SPHI
MRKISLGIILIGLTVLNLKANASSKIDNEKVFIDSLQKKVVDPVCKMKIKSTGAKNNHYKKVTYYFCSESCRQKFIAEPEKYIKE